MKKYHNTDEITLDDGSKLKDFDWWLSEFHHNYEAVVSQASVIMVSGGFRKSRTYSISNPATFNENALLAEILKLPEFINSNPI